MDQEADPERLARVEAALARLPAMERQIFLAMRLDGMDIREIARRTGLSKRQVQKRIGAAIKALGRSLAEDDETHG